MQMSAVKAMSQCAETGFPFVKFPFYFNAKLVFNGETERAICMVHTYVREGYTIHVGQDTSWEKWVFAQRGRISD